MRSCGWQPGRGEGLVTSCFIWAQLDLMFERRTGTKPGERRYCHYGDCGDGLSWEELGNKESEDMHTQTQTYCGHVHT